MPSSPTAREALTRIASPGWSRLATSSNAAASGIQRRDGVGSPPRYGRAPSPTAIDELDAELVEQGADLLVVARRRVAELGHLAQDRDATPAACARGEVESAARIDVGLAL